MLGLGTYDVKDAEFIKNAIVQGGYWHIDTASMYENEEVVGEAIKVAIEEGVSREEMFVTTKCFVHETKIL